ncbi:MAG: hypothetical protein IKK88_04705 [Oscillospiraceae bacterium]|nr:hypothetical protein [Oscillospiraceae bacterium]
MTDNIYKQLFDIAHENIMEAKSDFSNSESTFLFYCENDQFSVDISELMKIKASNEEFIQLAYLALLNRPIDPDAINVWSTLYNTPQKKFRVNAVYNLLNSNEFSIKGKKVYNNTIKKVQPNAFIKGAYKIYRHCPAPINDLLKKTARRLNK